MPGGIWVKNSLTRVEEISGPDGATAGHAAGLVGIMHGLNRWRLFAAPDLSGEILPLARRNRFWRTDEIFADAQAKSTARGGGLVTPELRKERRR